MPNTTANCGCEYGTVCPHDCCKPKYITLPDGSIGRVLFTPIHFRENLKSGNETRVK